MREAAGIVGGLRRGHGSGAKLPFGHSLNPNLPAGGRGGTGRHQPRIQVPGRAGKVVGCPGLRGTPCDSGSASTPALPRVAPHLAGSGTSTQNPIQKRKSLTEASGRFEIPPHGGRCYPSPQIHLYAPVLLPLSVALPAGSLASCSHRLT